MVMRRGLAGKRFALLAVNWDARYLWAISMWKSPGTACKVADTVGAGDAFSAAFLHGLNAGWPAARLAILRIVWALVASRPGGAAPWSLDEIEALSRSA